MELPSQLSEQSLNLLALVASMPCLGHVLETCLGKTAPIMVEKASQSYSITKLNSRLELQRRLVDKVLDLYWRSRLAPGQESLWC